LFGNGGGGDGGRYGFTWFVGYGPELVWTLGPELSGMLVPGMHGGATQIGAALAWNHGTSPSSSLVSPSRPSIDDAVPETGAFGGYDVGSQAKSAEDIARATARERMTPSI
jgi:hypothetical protein